MSMEITSEGETPLEDIKGSILSYHNELSEKLGDENPGISPEDLYSATDERDHDKLMTALWELEDHGWERRFTYDADGNIVGTKLYRLADN